MLPLALPAMVDAMKITRVAIASVVLLGAGLGLSACQSSSYRCVNSDCTVTLSGAGASADVGSQNYTVALQGADGERATFSVDGTSASCTEGESLQVGSYSATCTEVGENRLVVEISTA